MNKEQVNNSGKIKKLIVSNSSYACLLNIAEIEFLTSKGCYTDFYVNGKFKVTSSKPFKYYENLLKPYNFLRIHQKYIINLEYVSEVYKGYPLKIKLTSGTILPVSKLRKYELFEYYLF
ncbi:MAG: LytTR family transcriptional regulator [Bacteroidales bacterium]|nr:LytTR family transcriptional regulator [Bacteroidales bacterium]